jgi:hypothetical protein
MSVPAQDTSLIVFGEFLTDLRRRGFKIGVGHYLRLQELLNKAGPESTPQDMKTLIYPLFATSEVEQEQFYRAFDNFFTIFKPAPPEPAKPGDGDEALLFQTPTLTRRDARRRRLYYLVLASLVIAVAGVAGLLLAPQQTSQLIGDDPAQQELPKKVTLSPEGGESPTPTPPAAQHEISRTENMLNFLRAVRYEIGLPMFFIMIITPLVLFLFYDQPLQGRRAGGRLRGRFNAALLWLVVVTYALRWYVYRYDPPRLERVLDYLPVDLIDLAVLTFFLFLIFYRRPPYAPQDRRALYERLRPFILGLAVLLSGAGFLFQMKQNRMALLAPLIFFLIYEWHRRRHRKLVLQKQRGKRPPYVWPVRVEAFAPKLYDEEGFYDVAREMRRRQAGEYVQLDVDATIRATVTSVGYPSFRYRLSSRPPEYLILVDRAGFRDHQAQLFNELAKALEREGVYVARFFFDGDPRVCCNEYSGGCVSLAELHSRFAGHRLLIFGDGEMLREPVGGEPAGWTSIFAEWRDRALLTPCAASEWGLREISLAQLFVVLPATLEGLLALVAHFEVLGSESVRAGWQGGAELPLSEVLNADSPGFIEELRRYLGEDVFQWLAACAAYPELHWDLTLYLGSLPEMGRDLIREENLLRLIRLPWFRRGSIPDETRWLLIRELERGRERAVRNAVIELLERNPPPAGTYAADAYRLNIAVQRWLLRRNPRQQWQALEALSAAPRVELERDYTLIRFLESSSSHVLSMVLPSRMRRIFYRDGIPAFGLKMGARLLLVALVTLAGFGMRELQREPAPEYATVSPPPRHVPTVIARLSDGRLKWVDEEGTVLGSPNPGDADFFVRGLDESNTEAARRENQEKISVAVELARDWKETNLSRRVSELNLDDLRDVRVQLAGPDAAVEVRLGKEEFGKRLRQALEVLDAQRSTPRGPYVTYVDVSQGKRAVVGTGSTAQYRPDDGVDTASVRGAVIDSDGKPIKGAKVTVDDAPEMSPVVTSGNGIFTLEELRKEDGSLVKLRVVKEGYQPNPYIEAFSLGGGPVTIRLRKIR